ncbi:MAG: bifunctional 5,10-methylenetetrahydrofolate dehydrogenase/5,10-methenyltetrahydrofolate cyclohydrolase [Planctomycetes bacterium]|jgi:methylenetetrahydrofolate dehydrogenase (NADP+)/methenyltetrahydrofolate cyclohydrolase|nr:bifunctional 5,10-methylenetetrahydrofolate dehydrogenase/5,10-methenyltetrahydrofolate cyclohydrolase [Planctomycetota bacterium]
MPAQILDGKAVAKAIKEKLAAGFAALKFKPKLVSFAVGVDDGTTSYRKSQKKQAEALGVAYEMVDLPESATAEQVVSRLRELNGDPGVTGIILQLPVPKHLNGEQLARLIAPQKNIEGIDEVNLGAIVMKKYRNIPCTARAAVELAAHSGVDLNGANAVVIGRSTIVGKPASLLLLDRNCTVTMCHSKSKNLKEIAKSADVLVTAIGTKAGMVTGDWIKPGAVVVDVGIIDIGEGKIRGDVDFDSASQVAGWITPVPGGVGPVTTQMLYMNLLDAAKVQQ